MVDVSIDHSETVQISHTSVIFSELTAHVTSSYKTQLVALLKYPIQFIIFVLFSMSATCRTAGNKISVCIWKSLLRKCEDSDTYLLVLKLSLSLDSQGCQVWCRNNDSCCSKAFFSPSKRLYHDCMSLIIPLHSDAHIL